MRTRFASLLIVVCTAACQGPVVAPAQSASALSVDDAGNFVKSIGDSDAGKLIALGSKMNGYLSTVLGLFSGKSDSDRILERIASLEAVINDGFQQLGNLVQQQTGIVLGKIDALGLQQAQADAMAASRTLYTYSTAANPGLRDAALGQADALSARAVAFLKQQTDPFYLGGLVAAGTVRLDVLHYLQPDLINDAGRVAEINEMADRLTALIETVKATVDASHHVAYGSVSSSCIRKGQLEDVDLPAYVHVERDLVVASFAFRSPMQCDVAMFSDPVTAARQARDRGLQAELQFMGIPQLESLRDQWRGFAANASARP